jgi:hypothetical protein
MQSTDSGFLSIYDIYGDAVAIQKLVAMYIR